MKRGALRVEGFIPFFPPQFDGHFERCNNESGGRRVGRSEWQGHRNEEGGTEGERVGGMGNTTTQKQRVQEGVPQVAYQGRPS